MKSRGKTRNIGTSLAREINNNKELTILRLRNARRKEKNVEQLWLVWEQAP